MNERSKKILMVEACLFDELASCLQGQELGGQFKVAPYFSNVLLYSQVALQPNLIIFQDRGATDDGIGELRQKIDFAKRKRPQVKIALACRGLDENYLKHQLKRPVDGVLKVPFQVSRAIDLIAVLLIYPIFEVADAIRDDGSLIDLFALIKAGKKRVDIRAYTDKYKAVMRGDVIVFRSLNTREMIRRKISMIIVSPTFQSLFDEGCGPDLFAMAFPGLDYKEAVNIIYHWSDSKEKYEEHGAVAFVLEEV